MIGLLEIIDQVPEIARLLVLEEEKIRRPQADLMSKSAAMREYGQAWVKRMIDKGMLKIIYHGNRKMLSRSEMERVKAKENVSARLVLRRTS